MKNFLILFLMLFISVSIAQTNNERAQTLTSRIEKHLGLSNESKTKVYELILNKMNLIDKSIQENKGDKNAQPVMIEKRKFFSEMGSLLNEEQFQTWQRIRSEHLVLYREGKDVPDMIFDPEMENITRK